TEEIPSVLILAGSVNVVAGIELHPGLGRLQGHDGVEHPALQYLSHALLPGNVPGGCEREAVPNIEVTIPVLRREIPGVLRDVVESAVRHVVERMRIGITGDE